MCVCVSDVCSSSILAENAFKCQDDDVAEATTLIQCIGIKNFTIVFLNTTNRTLASTKMDLLPFLTTVQTWDDFKMISIPKTVNEFHFFTRQMDNSDLHMSSLRVLFKPLQLDTWIVCISMLFLCFCLIRIGKQVAKRLNIQWLNFALDVTVWARFMAENCFGAILMVYMYLI